MSDFRSVALSDENSQSDTTINQNPTNHERFRKFQENLEKKIERFEVESRQEQRRNNVLQWDSNTSERWRGASLKNHPETLRKQIESYLREDGVSSFFVKGPQMSGKTHLAHAICRRLIGAGILTPKSTFMITEEEVLRYANSGFAGRDKINDLMNRKYSMVILDGVGNQDFYNSKREEPAVRQLIETYYSNGTSIIFTSRGSAAAFNKMFHEPIEGRLVEMIGERIVSISSKPVQGFDDWDESELQQPSNDLPLDKFK